MGPLLKNKKYFRIEILSNQTEKGDKDE